MTSNSDTPSSATSIATTLTPETFIENTAQGVKQLKEILLQKDEWSAFTVINADGNVICSAFDVNEETHISDFTDAFTDRDKTIGRGFMYQGKRFEVHRWHPPLIYGRHGLPSDSEGIALLKGTLRDGEALFVLISYKPPILVGKTAPELIELFKRHLGDVAPFETPSITQHPNWRERAATP